MRMSLALAVIVIIVIAAGAFGVLYLYQKQVFKPQSIFRASTTSSPTPSPIAAKFLDSATPSPEVQPASGSNTAQINLGISVDNPNNGQTISSPITVNGFANVENEKVRIIVKDANGEILGEGAATACLDLRACFYQASIVFAKSQTQNGSVAVRSQD